MRGHRVSCCDRSCRCTPRRSAARDVDRHGARSWKEARLTGRRCDTRESALARRARGAPGLALVVLCALCAPGPAFAHPQDQSPPDEQIDVWDWLKHLRKKTPATQTTRADENQRRTTVLVVPTVSAKPSTGLSGGAGANIEFPLGDVSRTRISFIHAGASFSTKKQYSVSARALLFGADNRWSFSGDHHYKSTGQQIHGVGTGLSTGDAVDITYKSTEVVDTYYRAITSAVWAGAGIQFLRQTHVRPVDLALSAWDRSPYVVYSNRHGFDVDGQTSAGVNVSLRADTRDNVADPGRGWYADSMFRAHFADFLGGDSTWQALYLDLRTYQPLTKDARHKLAFRIWTDVVTGGAAPYLALPAIGNDPTGRSGRGYSDGRFRGDRLVYGEAEYRVSLRRDGLVGMVAFVNATTVGSAFEQERLFDAVAVAGGIGFRLRLQKRSRTNLCFDIGRGQGGSHGVYIALAEAF